MKHLEQKTVFFTHNKKESHKKNCFRSCKRWTNQIKVKRCFSKKSKGPCACTCRSWTPTFKSRSRRQPCGRFNARNVSRLRMISSENTWSILKIMFWLSTSLRIGKPFFNPLEALQASGEKIAPSQAPLKPLLELNSKNSGLKPLLQAPFKGLYFIE